MTFIRFLGNEATQKELSEILYIRYLDHPIRSEESFAAPKDEELPPELRDCLNIALRKFRYPIFTR